MKKNLLKLSFIFTFSFVTLFSLLTSVCQAKSSRYRNPDQKSIFLATLAVGGTSGIGPYNDAIFLEWNDARYGNVKKWLIYNGIKASKAGKIRKVRYQVKVKGKWRKSKYIGINLKRQTVGFGFNGQLWYKVHFYNNTDYPLKVQFCDSKNKVVATKMMHILEPDPLEFGDIISCEKTGPDQVKVTWKQKKYVKGYTLSYEDYLRDDGEIKSFPNDSDWVFSKNIYTNSYTFKRIPGASSRYFVRIESFSKYGDQSMAVQNRLVILVDIDEGKVYDGSGYGI